MYRILIALAVTLTAISGCGNRSTSECVVPALSAMGNVGITGNARPQSITPYQCKTIERMLSEEHCDTKAIRFMAENPEGALRTFVSGQERLSKGDIDGMRSPAQATLAACRW
jgi:dissimilatory sulfite reductase (desulfoviridin) alpha/beta subunit